MRAIQADAPGGPERLREVEVDAPSPGAGEVRVRVEAAGVNYADTMLRRNAYFVPVAFPLIPGAEVVGTVEEVGAGVEGWRVGDRIAGVRPDGRGGYAEQAILSAAHAAPVPARLASDLATAVLNQGLTAQGLIESAPEIAHGATVLVTAAAGGVGGFLVQLARLAGAGAVVAAASDVGKLEDAAEASTPCVSYADPDWPSAVRRALGGRGVDVVIDAVGGDVRAASVKATAPRGRILFYGAASGSTGITDAVLTQVMGRNVSLTGYAIHTSIAEDAGWLPRTLARLFALAGSGELRAPIHPPFALAAAAEAHRALESRRTRGKVLLHVP